VSSSLPQSVIAFQMRARRLDRSPRRVRPVLTLFYALVGLLTDAGQKQ